MAWSAADYDIDFPATDISRISDFIPGNLRNILRNGCPIRKIKFMNTRMNGIDFDCCNHVEPRLLESEAHSARTRKQIDCNWTRHFNSLIVIESYVVNEIDDLCAVQGIRVNFDRRTSASFVSHCQIVSTRHPARLRVSTDFGVPLPILDNLFCPESNSALWQLALWTTVAVPKTAVYEDDRAMLCEYDVGFSGEVSPVQTKSAAHTVQSAPDD